MSLEALIKTPGLWRDANWKQGMPGVYALVVGVSAYPFLEGGQAASLETYGLTQLLTSATTAAEVFRWLKTSFCRNNLPVVWCWLLLSPTEKERETLTMEGLTHYSEPTYENLRTAIGAWTGNIPKQAPASDVSRSFFFFSGHGVQSHRNAVLLPCNYLDTTLGGDPDVQNCIAVDDLKEWMEESPVAEHIALLDACRNEFSPLASKGATAYQLFPANVSTSTGPKAAATLSATSPNSMAYQFEGLPFTFFGQAVLDALAGGAAAGRNSGLEFNDFVDYVKQRVNTLLLQKAPQEALEQSVRKSFEGIADLIITEFTLESSSANAISPDSEGINLEISYNTPISSYYAHTTARDFTESAAPVPSASPPDSGEVTSLYSQSRIREELHWRFDDALDVNDTFLFKDVKGGLAHSIFGHEYVSGAWDNAELFSLEDGKPWPDGAKILRVKRNDLSSLVEVDLALEPRRGGVLLVFQRADFVERERLAIKLPTDQNETVPIRLTLSIGPLAVNAAPKLQKIQGWLGPCDWNKHYSHLYSLSREADLGSLRQAAERVDPNLLKEAIHQMPQAESAATAGMLLMAEAGTIVNLGDLPRNLMQQFPLFPDGAVLWAQTLRDALASGVCQPYGETKPLEAILTSLELAAERGVPFFAESLEIAHSLVRHLRRADLTSVQRHRLDGLSQSINLARSATVPAGHFLLVPGLPRPEGMAGGPGALSVDEIMDLLRGAS